MGCGASKGADAPGTSPDASRKKSAKKKKKRGVEPPDADADDDEWWKPTTKLEEFNARLGETLATLARHAAAATVDASSSVAAAAAASSASSRRSTTVAIEFWSGDEEAEEEEDDESSSTAPRPRPNRAFATSCERGGVAAVAASLSSSATLVALRRVDLAILYDELRAGEKKDARGGGFVDADALASALRKIDRAEIAGTTADAAGDAFDDWTMKHALFRAVDEDGASVSRIADVVAAMQVLCGGGGGSGAAAEKLRTAFEAHARDDDEAAAAAAAAGAKRGTLSKTRVMALLDGAVCAGVRAMRACLEDQTRRDALATRAVKSPTKRFMRRRLMNGAGGDGGGGGGDADDGEDDADAAPEPTVAVSIPTGEARAGAGAPGARAPSITLRVPRHMVLGNANEALVYAYDTLDVSDFLNGIVDEMFARADVDFTGAIDWRGFLSYARCNAFLTAWFGDLGGAGGVL